MQMNMKNRLPAIAVAVKHDPVAASVYPLLFGNPARRQNKLADNCPVFRFEVIDGRNMSLGDQDDMLRRLRIYILECDDIPILEDPGCRDFVHGDFAKDAVPCFPHWYLHYL
jgi:hypothetical protein